LTDIYWFQHDLRLRDNPGLLSHARSNTLLLVYFWPEARPWCNLTGIGEQRHRFLLESLAALREELGSLGQKLLISSGEPHRVLPELVRTIDAGCVGTSLSPGYYERLARERVAASLSVPLRVHGGNVLFDETQLPFDLASMPGQFTPFRNMIEAYMPLGTVPAPARLPAPPPGIHFGELETAGVRPHTSFPVRGGSTAAHRRLQQFVFDRQDIVRYKQTRNTLDGLSGSSSLSPWLALGCLSAREVAAAIEEFERDVLRNESTEWLLFELLWREFFHWRALADDVSLFHHGGAPRRVHHCTFEPRNFARWCQGDTNFPLVNALMHQLVESGWMSNRGRQIAASCLVNEYGIDWRYGAAFFEKHLIDYDVASNYGNWQYLAGVGADPRGGRHFNLQKQTTEHDPQGLFVGKWKGQRPQQPDHVVDAADWPID
jgi:cryptochrome